MRHLRLSSPLLLCLAGLCLGCEGSLTGPIDVMVDLPADAGRPAPLADGGPGPATEPDAAPPLATDGGALAEPDAWILVPIEPDAGPPAPVRGALAPDLRVSRVDLFQTVRVPLVRSGAAADRDDLPVVAGREAMVRVHAAALSGWSAREITAVVEIDDGAATRRFTDTRVPALPASDDDPDSVFAVRVPGDAIALGARFRVRLEDEGGVADAPEARYPSDGSSADLEVEDVGVPTVVLVPFRYETDGSGRLPDVSDAQLARIRAELTSRFPYAEIDLRVHDIVTWSRSNRVGGNVDWGAVNARLISMRDAEGAAESEYWYGLVAPDTSRSAYCDRVIGSCVTGQAYVATLHGSRVGSGVGFSDVASVRTLAHEIGHEHGRSHTPCGTSSSDDSYPYSNGYIGVWGWDRRDGAFHDPDTGTDMMGYCSRQWISDYTYRAMYRRQIAMRAATWSLVGAPVARRFVTLEDGATSWSEVTPLRTLPGELGLGTFVDARGRALATVEIARLDFADSDGVTWIVPAEAPAGATAITLDGTTLALP